MTSPVQITSHSILKRYSALVASPADRPAAELVFLTGIGAHLGRKSALLFNGQQIYPTLYSLVLTEPSTLIEWHRPLKELNDAPQVTKSGISRPESLIYLVRDAVLRPDKVYTDKGEDPEWREAMVDEGVRDKRHIIMQRLGRQLASSRRLGATNLLDALIDAYDGGSLAAYVGYRDGGFHRTDTAHIVLLLPEPDPQIAAALYDELPLLLAKADGPMIYPRNIAKVREVLSDACHAIEDAPREVTVAPEANWIIESEIASGRPYAMLTLLRVAHIVAVLERSSIATEALFRHAAEIVQASESTHQEIREIKFRSLHDKILEFVGATPCNIPGNQIVRHFRRKHGRVEIRAALSVLRERGQLSLELVRTSGRTREEWSIPKAS